MLHKVTDTSWKRFNYRVSDGVSPILSQNHATYATVMEKRAKQQKMMPQTGDEQTWDQLRYLHKHHVTLKFGIAVVGQDRLYASYEICA